MTLENIKQFRKENTCVDSGESFDADENLYFWEIYDLAGYLFMIEFRNGNICETRNPSGTGLVDGVYSLIPVIRVSDKLYLSKEALETIKFDSWPLLIALFRISESVTCWGPGCHFCDSESGDHPKSNEAKIAKEALIQAGIWGKEQ